MTLDPEGGALTAEGERFLAGLGVAAPAAGKTRRAFCRPCLDWSERRFHVAGTVGAGIARHALEQGWIARLRDSRAVVVTEKGRIDLRNAFGLEVLAERNAA